MSIKRKVVHQAHESVQWAQPSSVAHEPQDYGSVAGGSLSGLSGHAPAAASGAAALGIVVLPPAELADANATTVAHGSELFPVPAGKYADAPAAPAPEKKL